jgi:hypothetical protein
MINTNQPDIIAGLQAAGCSVEPLNIVSSGVPSLLCGWAGRNTLIEVKSDDGNLTPEQTTWHTSWAGQVEIARSIDDALRIVGLVDDPLPIVLQNFWATLTPSAARVVCPKCEARGLEARSAEHRGRKCFYTRHCDRILEITQR